MPAYFNAALDQPASLFIERAQKEEGGWKLSDGSFLAIILFADNYWLIARSHSVLQKMTEYWIKLLADFGWNTPCSEMTWCSTATDDSIRKFFIDICEIHTAKRSEGFKALGCQITFNGGNGDELKLRISRAWLSFNKYYDILCNKSASFRNRALLLKTLVANALFWCSGSWTLTNAQLSELRGVQLRMLRKMCCRRDKLAVVTTEGYLISANHLVKALKQKHQILDWDIVALHNHFAWAGYVSRLVSCDPRRVTLHVLRFKDFSWLSLVESANGGRQLHCRCLRVWRWEYPLVQYAKYCNISDWHALAANTRSWIECLERMAQWFRVNRATKL
jgi:hypothetical protein